MHESNNCISRNCLHLTIITPWLSEVTYQISVMLIHRLRGIVSFINSVRTNSFLYHVETKTRLIWKVCPISTSLWLLHKCGGGLTTNSAKTRPYHVPSTSLHDVLFHSSTGPVWKFAGRSFLDVASPSISDIQRTCVQKRPQRL